MADLYAAYCASFNRDGADYSIIERARGSDREKLETDLIENLDFYEVPALGMMKSKRAVPHLKQKLETSDGAMQVLIAKALRDIVEHADTPKIIISVLASHAPDIGWSDKTRAAFALRSFNTDEANAALRNAMFDADYLVRYHAAMSLAENRGRKLTDTRAAKCLSTGDEEQITSLADWLDHKRHRF